VAVAGGVFDGADLGEADLVVDAWTDLRISANARSVRLAAPGPRISRQTPRKD
jgi:hypothetical protein